VTRNRAFVYLAGFPATESHLLYPAIIALLTRFSLNPETRFKKSYGTEPVFVEGLSENHRMRWVYTGRKMPLPFSACRHLADSKS
jgi:hypothetical protein